MNDILKKLGLGLIISGAIMLLLLAFVTVQNYLSTDSKVTVSGFYLIMSLVFIFAGFKLKKLNI